MTAAPAGDTNKTGSPRPRADIYLRLSDLRTEDPGALDGREAALRTKAAELGWDVHRVIIENDLTPAANGNGRSRPASAFKRRKIRLPSGQVALRTVRPGFRRMLDDLTTGAASALLAEDLDRLLRQPRDGEDLLDAVELSGATARSLSGSLTLTNGGTDAERFTARIMAAVANKSSSDTARRVAAARERHAGKSYGGGKRPYGFRPDPESERYHRRLLVVPDEAAVIKQVAADILDKDISLKAAAAGLREAGVPTASGAAAWSPSTLRDVLLKPANAKLTIHPVTRELIDAPWEAILPRDRWQALRDKLTDPARRTSPGNEPRWLVSKIARCFCGATTHVNGVARGSAAYWCDTSGHLKRSAARVDEFVEGRMIWFLSESNVRDDGLLMPPPVPGEADAAALRAELAELRRRRREQMRMHARGDLDDGDLTEGLREIRDLTGKTEAKLAAASRTDPLAEFRNRPADVVWDSLTVARKRAIIRLLADITFVRVAPGGPKFNPDSVHIDFSKVERSGEPCR